MPTFAAIVILTLVIASTTVRRMWADDTKPVLFWLMLIPAAASPMVSGWMAIFPGDVADQAALEPPNGRGTFTIPADHDLIVNATLMDLGVSEVDDPDVAQTDYVIKLSGGSWEQTLMGKIKRGAGTVRVSDGLDGGASISTEGTGLAILWGEDRQDRFRAAGTGLSQVWIGNWHGRAASAVAVQAVPGTPPRSVLLGLMGLFVLLAVFCDARLGTDRLTADFAVLSCASLFIAEQVTPDGGLRAVLFTLGFAIIGGGIGGKMIGFVGEALIGKRTPAPDPPPVVD